MSVQRAGQQQEKQLQDALSSMSAENQKFAEELATKDSLAKQLHSSLAVKIAAIAQLEEDLRSAERIVDSVQRDVQGIREDADILKRTMLVVCQTKIVLLEKEIYRLRDVVDEEREKRAKAEHEQRETELRNIECEKLMQEAENKLAKIKKQLALELVIKETELSRLQEQQKESDTQYGYIRAWLDHPVAVALTYDADFDEVAANPEAADQFNAQVHEQVSAALGIPKTAGKKFSDLKLSESRDSRSISVELTTGNFCSASYLLSARQGDCGGSAEKGDKARRRQRPSPPCSACARAGRNGQ